MSQKGRAEFLPSNPAPGCLGNPERASDLKKLRYPAFAPSLLRDQPVMTRLRLRGGALLGDEGGFEAVQSVDRGLLLGQAVLLKWDLDLAPAREVHVVVLARQFLDSHRLLGHGCG